MLARKAGSLGSQVMLSGWLFRTTRFVAARALRAEHQIGNIAVGQEADLVVVNLASTPAIAVD